MLFSPRAVGGQQEQQNEVHCIQDRRRPEEREIGLLLQDSGREQAGVPQIPEEPG